jgi:hypothetical protein
MTDIDMHDLETTERNAPFAVIGFVALIVVGFVFINPIGAVGTALFFGPIWLWIWVGDPYVKRRRLAKRAAEEAAEAAEWAATAIPVEESELAIPAEPSAIARNSLRTQDAASFSPTFWRIYKVHLWDAVKAFVVFQAARISLICVAAITGEGRHSPETDNVIVIGAAMVACMYFANLKRRPEKVKQDEAFRTRIVSGACVTFARIRWAAVGSIIGKVAAAGAKVLSPDELIARNRRRRDKAAQRAAANAQANFARNMTEAACSLADKGMLSPDSEFVEWLPQDYKPKKSVVERFLSDES